ncbi:MAG: hypothetical protein NW208_19230 [Bryobacter sp.]|nr:hypothetical protein [Bryobacter sp.]
MFSTIARPETRIIHIFLETPEGIMAGQLPEPEGWKARQLRAIPTRTQLEALRQRLSGYQWLLPLHQTLPPSPGASPYPPALATATALTPQPRGAKFDPTEFRLVPFKAIRVEIHQLDYNPASRQVLLRELPR